MKTTHLENPVMVTVHANISQTNSEIVNITNHNYRSGNNRNDIVWDNNMSYIELVPAILDVVNGIDIGVADDFMFTEDTAVLDVRWIGGYMESGYQQGNFDWFIVFYLDRGDGNAPGTQILVHSFFQSQCNPVVIEDTGYDIFYEFTATLPEPYLFQANTKYWIGIFGLGEHTPMSGWAAHLSPILLHEAVYGSEFLGVPYWTEFLVPGDMCFQLLAAPFPDLECDGSLSWTDVEPEGVVAGSFEVENIGDPGSMLNWEVAEYPDWGTWVFEPDEGEDLTPEDGPFTIDVTVIAPDEQEQNYAGHITITNVEDSGDFCIIDVSLATPVNQQVDMHPLFQRILNRFPNSFLLLRYIGDR